MSSSATKRARVTSDKSEPLPNAVKSILLLYYAELGNQPHDLAFVIPETEFTPEDHALFSSWDYGILDNATEEDELDEKRKIVLLLGLDADSDDDDDDDDDDDNSLTEPPVSHRNFSRFRLDENQKLRNLNISSVYFIIDSC